MWDCLATMANFIKKVVSKEKRRYEEDGYNLDLTYITDRIIAMGFPASHIEAFYRNNLEDVKKMLEEKHRDHYKLYNLCSERSYDVAKFQNRVAYYPFDDHNPPEFSMMKTFCEDVEKWLAKNEENIAVVHCKAGKGRTGLMICAYLLHSKHNSMTSSEEVLRFYASKRTHNDQGVTIPSQRRYVDYYAAMLQERLQYSPVKLYLHSFVIDPVPNLGLNQADSYIQFEVRQKHIRLYESSVYQVKKTDSPITIKLPEALLMIDDVRIDINQYLDFFGKKITKSKFHFWVNTFFIDQERSSYLTHESLTSRPSLPVNAAAAVNPASSNITAVSAVWGEVQQTPRTVITVPSTIPATNCSGYPHQEPPSPQQQPRQQQPLPIPHQASPLAAVVGGARISRSAHNSGEPVVGGPGPGGAGVCEPGPLRENHRSDPIHHQVTASDDRLDTKSPNGSFVPNLISIPRNQKNVVLVDNNQLEGTTNVCDIVKSKYLSDDTLTDQHPNATLSAFNNDRKRHRSVPMMAKTDFGDGTGGMRRAHGGAHTHSNTRMNIQGKMMSVRLRKHQIDKADRDQGSKKFSENFNVTLFLIRPSNQTLQDEFLRPNCIAQHMDHCPGEYCTACPTPPPHPSAPPSGGRIPPYSPDSDECTSDEEDEDHFPHHHYHSASAGDNQTTWSHDAVFLPPKPPPLSSAINQSPQQLSSSQYKDSCAVPAGGKESSTCHWQMGGGQDSSMSMLSSSMTSSSVMSSVGGGPGDESDPAHHPRHPHQPQQHNHPLLHSYSSAATVQPATTVAPVVHRNASAESDQQQQPHNRSLRGLVRNQTESLAELCRRSTQTTWI